MSVTLTYDQFVADFPEFTNATQYPAPSFNYYLTLATNLLNADRWGNLINTGAELFIAHNLVFEAQAQNAANNNATPGTSQGGVLSSKNVDKVSISYDTASAIEEGAGHWNMTLYGRRYIRLSRMMGAGPLQVGVGYVDPLSSGNAWSGPDCTPGFANFS